MIAYEVQLRYVIRDKIRGKIHSMTKSSPRQNSVRDKFGLRQIWSKTKFSLRQNPRIFFIEKQFSDFVLDRILSLISSVQSELSRTNRCLSSLSDTYITQ